MPEFAPETLDRGDLWKLVASRLRYAIISSELQPGEHLRELRLAERFGVSRVPVREALIRLTHEGLVRGEPRRGAFVIGMSLADIRELYDVRGLLEIYAARLAAQRATSEDTASLQRLIADFSRESKRGDSEAVATIDIAFHRAVIVATHHARLSATWESLSGIIETLLTLTNEHSTHSRIMSSHRPLADAIAAGNIAAAEETTRMALDEGLSNAERSFM